ncbi:MAG: hypothetical protein HN909_02800 [Phycisphaerales bacterium]|nr:hypothetical protein [Phycisphaerales bacterium]MBT7170681.1 hypothetical protein [Phycisphaerales bacterium]
MTEINYNKLARVLDGESIPLDADELVVLADIRSSEEFLAPLSAALPQIAHLDHLMHKPMAMISRKRFLPRCVRALLTSSSVAAAIAIFFLTMSVAKIDSTTREISAEQLWAVGFESGLDVNEEFDIRLDQLASELQDQSREITLDEAIRPSPEEMTLDSGIDSIESQLQEAWTEDESALDGLGVFFEDTLSQGSTS